MMLPMGKDGYQHYTCLVRDEILCSAFICLIQSLEITGVLGEVTGRSREWWQRHGNNGKQR